MKTIYSMQEFYSQVLELAESKNESYIITRVTLDHHKRALFECYVNGYNWHKGDSMQTAIESLRNKMYPTPEPIKNIDVEIEVEENFLANS